MYFRRPAQNQTVTSLAYIWLQYRADGERGIAGKGYICVCPCTWKKIQMGKTEVYVCKNVYSQNMHKAHS